MKIILVRHAETAKNKLGYSQGNLHSEITPEGRLQLLRTQKYLAKVHIDCAFCSALERAKISAEIIMEPHNVKIVADSRLSEINWGDWAGLPKSELLNKWSEYYEEKKKVMAREDIRPPHGENSFDHLSRIKNFFEEEIFSREEGTILIVGHSGTNKVIVGYLQGKDPEEFYTIEQDNACINIIELKNRKIVKQEINKTIHLK